VACFLAVTCCSWFVVGIGREKKYLFDEKNQIARGKYFLSDMKKNAGSAILSRGFAVSVRAPWSVHDLSRGLL